MQFTGEVTSVVVGRLRQFSEPRLRQQAGIEKSQTSVERDILVQWVRIMLDTIPTFIYISSPVISNNLTLNLMGPENLLRDISGLEKILALTC